MKNASLPIIALAAFSAFPGPAMAQGAYGIDRYGHGAYMMGAGWYGMIFGPLFMILVLALVIGAVALLIRWLGGTWQGAAPGSQTPGRTALNILEERFARGEIDKEEYQERRQILGI
ncbi:MAG: SHOCT domain-containing protein [Rhizobiaceae bacterium]